MNPLPTNPSAPGSGTLVPVGGTTGGGIMGGVTGVVGGVGVIGVVVLIGTLGKTGKKPPPPGRIGIRGEPATGPPDDESGATTSPNGFGTAWSDSGAEVSEGAGN